MRSPRIGAGLRRRSARQVSDAFEATAVNFSGRFTLANPDGLTPLIVVNPTPLRHIGFRHWIGDEEAGVVVARAGFAIVEGERAVPLAEQPELATSDEFRGANTT